MMRLKDSSGTAVERVIHAKFTAHAHSDRLDIAVLWHAPDYELTPVSL